MSENEKIKVLIVDDLPEKVLVYQTVLEELKADLVIARSGPEALKQVLEHDFAVILLDVNMPDMDGFETAALIRSRKRSAHTPIIFITAFADDLHAIKGYSHGAVDYILSPVVPEVLRTKVNVFVQLFRLNQQVREQAARQIAIAEKERARLAVVLETATDFVGTIDANGRLLQLNRAGRLMLGIPEQQPIADTYYSAGELQRLRAEGLPVAIREGVWFGETALITRSGAEIPVSQVILAHKNDDGETESFSIIARDITDRRLADRTRALLAAIVDSTDDAVISKTLDGIITSCNKAAERFFGYSADELIGRSVRTLIPPERLDEEEMILGRIRKGESVQHFETVRLTKDGRHVDISLTVSPIRNADGQVVGASKIAKDIGERKAAERALNDSESRLRAMFGQAAVGIVLADVRGRLLEVNDRMSQIVGRSTQELRTMTYEDLSHPDDWSNNKEMIAEIVAGNRSDFAVEKRYQRGDGSWVWVNVTLSPLMDEAGRVHRLMTVVEDISARKLAEHEVQRHRNHLEDLVRERTEELKASHERLRLADRLASIGTLAAGLGHDMGNLLLPIRIRLESLERLELPTGAKEHIEAIKTAGEYLRRLSQGLRLFALDPEETSGSDEGTVLSHWWPDVEPFLRHALPRGVLLHSSLPELPPIAMPTHRFTQVVYNLVQNAGDAMRERATGNVRISAEPAHDGRRVVLSIADDGPGMSEEVRSRCMDPFFTTKTRRISTGLGLALVRGAVVKAGGTIEIESAMGKGTIFRMVLPTVERSWTDVEFESGQRSVACVALHDARLRAYVTSVLEALSFEVRIEPWSPGADVDLLVLDGGNGATSELESFLQEDARRHAVIFGGGPPTPRPQVFHLESRTAPAKIREALQKAARRQPGPAPVAARET